MVSPRDILAFSEREFACLGECGDDEDLFECFGIAGDDGDEFLEAYAKDFGVNLEGLLWYFHYNSNEPPNYETAWPHSPDGEKLDRIPITAKLLADAANAGYWNVQYPHHVVKGGWKATVPFAVMMAFVLAAVLLYALKM